MSAAPEHTKPDPKLIDRAMDAIVGRWLKGRQVIMGQAVLNEKSTDWQEGKKGSRKILTMVLTPENYKDMTAIEEMKRLLGNRIISDEWYDTSIIRKPGVIAPLTIEISADNLARVREEIVFKSKRELENDETYSPENVAILKTLASGQWGKLIERTR